MVSLERLLRRSAASSSAHASSSARERPGRPLADLPVFFENPQIVASPGHLPRLPRKGGETGWPRFRTFLGNKIVGDGFGLADECLTTFREKW